MHYLKTGLRVIALSAVLALPLAHAAEARIFIGGTIGVPAYYPAYPYPGYTYYPAPVPYGYYAPPPVAYPAPGYPPAYGYPAPAPAPVAPPVSVGVGVSR